MPVFTFDQWVREIGDDDDELAGSSLPNGAFTASNMMRYRTGLFGPRPGMKKQTISQQTSGDVVFLDALPSSSGTIIWGLNSSTSVKYFNMVAGNEGTVGTLNNAASPGGQWTAPDDPTLKVVLSGAGGIYDIDGSGVTGLTASFGTGGDAVGFYRGRLFGVDVGNKNRVHFSDIADRSTWDNFDYFEPSEAGSVYGYIPVQDTLYIQTEQMLWALDGSPISGRLRLLGNFGLARGLWPRTNLAEGVAAHEFTREPLIIRDRQVVRPAPYLRTFLSSAGGMRYDINYRGTIFGTLHYYSGTAPHAVLRYEGLWTKHSLGVEPNFSVLNRSAGLSDNQGEDIARIFNNDASNAALYWLFLSLDRPGLTSDTWANVGDNSSTPNTNTWSTAVITPEGGARVRVRKLRIWFQKWNTGSATNEGFTVEVETLGDPNASSYSRTASTHQFSEAVSDGSDMVDYYVGDQGWGTSFRLNFTGVHGVAFRRVVVYYDAEDDRP